MTVEPTLSELESQVEVETLGADPGGCGISARALDLLIDAFRQLSGSKLQTDQERVAYPMALNSLYSLTAAYRLLLKGYYRQSATLLRTAMEDWVTCAYVWKHPDKAALWLQPNYKKLPSFEDLRKELGEPFATRWRETYGMLSELAHPRLRAVWEAYKQLQRDAVRPYFDLNRFREISSELVIVVLSIFMTVPFVGATQSRSSELGEGLKRLTDDFEAWLEGAGRKRGS